MKPVTRMIIAIAALSMIASLYLPLWQIQLWAPQYPEGLNMKIWHNHLSGAFDIINGLNHYIGMRLIKEEMFPELAFIGILIGIYVAIGLFTAITGKINLLKIFVSTGLVYGALALYDFYQWGYDYGHNLDPHAAIQVPGMSYQPPVIGYKNLLNFTAYSGPDSGGWVIIGASLIGMILLVYEIMRQRKLKQSGIKVKVNVAALSLFLTLLISACSPGGPAPIRYGKDECNYCKMTLTDPKYGAEIITRTNKVYKFDDVNCLVNYINSNQKEAGKIKDIYIVDYSSEGGFIQAENALFLRSEDLKSPMGGAVAAFKLEKDRDVIHNQLSAAETLSWEKVKTLY